MSHFNRKPISGRSPRVVIEYDAPNGRKSKLFADAVAARRFYAAKLKAGLNPTVASGELPAATQDKPTKPYPEFPLYPHNLGYWSKKINGKIRHFGRWGHMKKGKVVYDSPDGWREALELYKQTVDTLQLNRTDDRSVITPADVEAGEYTIKTLCNDFLTAKLRKMEAKELSPATFTDYRDATDEVIKAFGKGRSVSSLKPDDFGACRAKLAKREIGAIRLGNLIGGIRGVFVWAIKNGKIDRSIDSLCGTEFSKPSKKILRRERDGRNHKVLTADEIKQLIDAAKNPQVKAMILLGINCGFGNTDCAKLTRSRINFKTTEIDYPRPKTGCKRRCPLWPETIEALKAVMVSDQDLVFLTKYGNPWVRTKESKSADGIKKYVEIDSVGQEFGKLLRNLHINGRHGLGFYSLRHTIATVGRGANDDEALKLIMGHGDHSMLNEHYTAEFPRARLDAVVNYVHAWLFGGDNDE